MKYKTVSAILFFLHPLFADLPETSVVVNSSTVSKITTNEPREVVFVFSRETGSIQASVSYETVVRIDGVPVSWEPLKKVNMTWDQLTNAIPALSQSLEQFKAAAKASMNNTP